MRQDTKAVHRDPQHLASRRNKTALIPVSTLGKTMTVPFSRQVSQTDLTEAMDEQQRLGDEDLASTAQSAAAALRSKTTALIKTYSSNRIPSSNIMCPDSSSSDDGRQSFARPHSTRSHAKHKVSKRAGQARQLQPQGNESNPTHLDRLSSHDYLFKACSGKSTTALRCRSAGSRYVLCEEPLYFKMPAASANREQSRALSSSGGATMALSVASVDSSMSCSPAFAQYSNPHFEFETT